MLVRDASSCCRSIEGGLTMKLAVIEKQNIPAALKKAVVLKRRNKESTMRDTGLLVLRLTTGGLIAGHGALKLFDWFGGSGLKGTAAIFESIGLKPGTPWAIAASAPEFGVSVAACLHTAERHLYLRTRSRRIEVDQPRLDVAHSTEREACILRENRRREPIFRRVRHLYSLLVRSYRQNRDEWAENLFACNTH